MRRKRRDVARLLALLPFGRLANAAVGDAAPAIDRGTVGPFPLPEGRWGPIAGWTNTIRDCLPDFLKPSAQNWTDIWPGAADLDERHEVAQFNGGHMADNMGATVYADYRTLTYRARNRAPGRKAENAMPGTGLPDEHGVHKAMHGYNGHLYRPARWGFGPDLFVLYTYYRDGGAVPNPLGFYDPTKELGGGDAFWKGERNRYLRGLGNYPTACACDFLRGWFVGDKNVSGYLAFADDPHPPVFAFVRGDGAPPDATWPNPVRQWKSTVLCCDEDRRLLIGISAGPVLDVVDLDAKRPGFRSMARVKVDVGDVPEAAKMEPDRTGFRWVRGRGLVGLYKLSTGETIGVQIVLGANAMADRATMRVVFRGIPSLVNGVFGSHVALASLPGITFLNSGPDTPPLQFSWPRI